MPWLLEVNLSGEASKSGVREDEIDAYRERYPLLRGLMTMPPFAEDPEASRPTFRRLRDLARAHGLADLSMGTSQDWRVAVEEGATLIRVGSTIFRRRRPEPGTTIERVMGFADVWNRTLVYFGIAEDEEWDEDGLDTQEVLEREYRSRHPARTCGSCRAP